ncbi:Caleosin related protein-domain-containing protein [Colletotrichum navitas]|uniref:Caleosin related protein-domain-containing protein n=1 Tax=Colletotrichum navitas TaxID=681940 RepID=A0AAD8PRF1_9PEZI|nr:Caleosin related protein-domain-containing protein [Colletotrichum navitas]KAK1574370.1 Caleosin related protein-domain-containing protein [Colletotrichum navitas]
MARIEQSDYKMDQLSNGHAPEFKPAKKAPRTDRKVKSVSNDDGPGFTTAVPMCPITYHRPPAVNAGKAIDSPGVAHANRAPSVDKPHGSVEYSEKYNNYTVLQQHVMFWDRNNDGVITPIDVWVGFRDLGFNLATCLLAATVIPFAFSYGTVMQYSYIPDPFFRLYVGGMHKAKHGSDSGIYDSEGRFVPQRFEDVFANCSARQDDTLTLGEVFGLMSKNRCAVDPFGWSASFFEWVTTWMLLAKDGKIHKEDLRRVYDGSLFWEIRDKRHSGKGWHQGWGIGGDWFLGDRPRLNPYNKLPN